MVPNKPKVNLAQKSFQTESEKEVLELYKLDMKVDSLLVIK